MIKNGDIVSFNIKARNLGYVNALNCVVNVTIPDGLEYYSSTCEKGDYVHEDHLWNIGGLEPSEEVNMSFSVMVVDDCELPKYISWVISTTTSEITLINNNGRYLVTDSCCAMRKCMEFLKRKHVWVDCQYGNDEAQLENILKPYVSVGEALAAIAGLGTLSEKEGWEIHVSGETDEEITFENLQGETIISFENFKTDSDISFDNIGTKIYIKGEIYKSGEGKLLLFSETVNLETVTLDLSIFRDFNDVTAWQDAQDPLGNIWIKSCYIESNEPFGLPVNGSPIIFKPIL